MEQLSVKLLINVFAFYQLSGLLVDASKLTYVDLFRTGMDLDVHAFMDIEEKEEIVSQLHKNINVP